MTKHDILQSWYKRVWIDVDLDAIDEIFRPDSLAEGVIPGMQMGPEDFRELVPMALSLINSPSFSLNKTLEDGDWASSVYTLSAFGSDNGRPIHCMGQVCARFEGDKIVEAYNSFDFMGLFEQVGLLPENSTVLCLTGQSLS